MILANPRERTRPLHVQLPDIDTVPEVWRGKVIKVSRLIQDGDKNTKLAKSNAKSKKYRTFGLSLAPFNRSGHNVCAHASKGCSRTCLFFQGNGRYDAVHAGRIARTLAFFQDREWFGKKLVEEMRAIASRCKESGFTPAYRLNVLSDLPWERIYPEIFKLPGVKYDYLKDVNRALKRLSGDWVPRYHLTFSRSENNELDCLKVLNAGGNVAVVFRNKPYPKLWRGFRIIDGDETDLRFLDPKNVVVGLIAKGTARKDNSGFVVDTEQKRFSLGSMEVLCS